MEQQSYQLSLDMQRIWNKGREEGLYTARRRDVVKSQLSSHHRKKKWCGLRPIFPRLWYGLWGSYQKSKYARVKIWVL